MNCISLDPIVLSCSMISLDPIVLSCSSSLDMDSLEYTGSQMGGRYGEEVPNWRLKSKIGYPDPYTTRGHPTTDNPPYNH